MWIFYLMSLVPIAIGAWLWHKNKEDVVWGEWLGGAAIALAMAGIFHYMAFRGMTDDVETWSGRVIQVRYQPEWTSRHTSTYKGRTTTTYRHHPAQWFSVEDYGEDQMERTIDKSEHDSLAGILGGQQYSRRGSRPSHHSGDYNDYFHDNAKNVLIPVTTTRNFENRVKAAPTAFSFKEVPDFIDVYEYPVNHPRASSRVLGTASKAVPILLWDDMNSRVGPRRSVNVIIIGFGNRGVDYAEHQRAKWFGGKKNDLVLCYGGESANPTWAYVFGWTEKELVKKNLESILLKGVNSRTVPEIEAEIVRNYVIKDWSKFDYITIEPPLWAYWVFFLVQGISQLAFWLWAHNNAYREYVRHSFQHRYWGKR